MSNNYIDLFICQEQNFPPFNPTSYSDTMEKHDEVLVALRQIIRAIDMHSKRLIKEAGLTSPQLLLLKGIDELGQISMRQLADHTNMSQATATTIMDRLESRQLVQRVRSETDKRKVHATLTDAGRALLAEAPTPLQESFIQRFQSLETWEQTLLLSSLQRISAMMNADGIDAAPVLSVSPLTAEQA
ncbi:HTH-type transcriptional regulator SarZ [Aeromonas jandaei]|nr:HTH-type transcriptional regulator SarZ [Aeromonas jandaei]